MDAARKFVDKGQIDKAVKEYLRIVTEDPKDVRIWLKIGDLYAKKGAKQDAIETYLKVARFYHDQGFLHKSVAVYKQIVKLDPRLVDVILRLAELYRELRMLPEAMQHFESVAAHFHREGNTKEALAAVKKLVDLDPENIATRIKLAELYSKEGLVDDAANEFQTACDQLRRQGRQDDFVKVAERLLWHKPNNQPLNRELAAIYLRRSDPRRALQKLQACFKADPRDVETLALLAQAFQALDQKAKTVSVLKELARIHLDSRHKEQAGEVYRKILELVPGDPDALAFLGPSAQAAAPTPTPVPARRPPTPIPAQVRAQAAEARLNLTGDLYEPASARMTGAMPLIDEQSLSELDFALPDYDDADFSVDMEPPPDPRAMSADGERHAEEISKILAETDVYVKYNLHQKAIDHLRRVFMLDADNVEARERLKDILVSQGREREAEAELLRLAEVVAPSDPDRAEVYLQELLAMNAAHTEVYELARRYRLRVSQMPSSLAEVEAPVEYGGAIGTAGGELDDLGIAPPARRRSSGVRTRTTVRDPIDEFDPHELIGRPIAHGSPAPGRPPQPPGGGYPPAPESFDFDFEASSPSQSTRQMSPEVVDALASAPGDEIAGDPAIWAEALDDTGGLGDADLGVEIDRRVAGDLAPGAATGDLDDVPDLPFDPAEARAFDAGVPGRARQGSGQSSRRPGSGMRHPDRATEWKGARATRPSGETDALHDARFEETALPVPAPGGDVDTGSYDAVADDALPISGSYDPYGDEAAQALASLAEPTIHTVPSAFIGDALQRAETSFEDELEQAEFYAGQGMYAEAIDVLNALLARAPDHRLVVAKLREIQALAAAGDVAGDAGSDAAGPASEVGPEMIDLDEIEEVGPDELIELDADSQPIPAPKKRRPAVMLEQPVDEGDAATHYDLGLAYKEMALHEDAIKAFENALRAPGREIQCRVMIGMCLREMGNPSEAVHQFKQGLHARPTERERLSLYYELGITYEAMGDDSEALYYLEMVLKRDPGFADAPARAGRLRARGGHAARSHGDDT